MADRGDESAQTVLVAGTASHVGKSAVAAGLCRLLARRGLDVAPYKAQNMSNNARAVPVAGAESSFGEVGVSQYVQARAAGVRPTTDVNPVLLKPRGDGESQIVLQGEAVGHDDTDAYYDDRWEAARAAAVESYERLAAEHDVVVAEGAGSIAEINLHDRDLANVETARFADADVLLVADVERGGVFASVYGTLELLPADLRERVVGVVINKFRGDRSVLEPGIEQLEALVDVPVLGVLPYASHDLPDEDSVSLPAVGERAVCGDDDDVPAAHTVTVAVPRLPRISNFTDLEPLARVPGVRVAYVPLSTTLDEADAVVVPGSKNTVDDLRALRDAGFGETLASFDGPIVGLCGGYQLLGERLTGAHHESTDDLQSIDGLGVLPVETRFSETKRVEAVTTTVRGHGLIDGATGTISGYEIHMGETTPTADVARPFDGRGAATDRALGTYLHGLFENEAVRDAFVDTVFEHARRSRPTVSDEGTADSTHPGSSIASLLESHVDLAPFEFEATGRDGR